MPITIEANFDGLTDLQFSTQGLMREVGLLAREIILRRTLRGIDVSGAPFHPYSASYATRKAKALGGDAGSVVNLQVSGDMLNNLQIVDVTDRSVTLGFAR